MTTSRRIAAALAALALAVPAPAAAWRIAAPDHAWAFPRDHWAHDGYRTEWWYLTGHLEAVDDPSARFGFQFTLFRVGIATERPPLDSAWATSTLVMGHAAITDLRAKVHRFSDVLRRETPLLGGFAAYPDRPLGWVLAPAGTDGRWVVDWTGEGFDVAMRDDAKGMAFRLATRPAKPLVLQGPNGYSRKGTGPTAASLYYSFTRLATEGTLTLDGRTWRVRGTSWMDKELGSSQLSSEQVGWDWWSLQLDDGRDLMLYVLRRPDGLPDHRNGTLVERDGAARFLGATGWSVTSTATWTSPRTRATYPIRWTVSIPGEGIVLDVVPRLADQENRADASGGIFYWEGSVEVRSPDGRVLGQGYVELTGYGEGNRPPV